MNTSLTCVRLDEGAPNSATLARRATITADARRERSHLVGWFVRQCRQAQIVGSRTLVVDVRVLERGPITDARRACRGAVLVALFGHAHAHGFDDWESTGKLRSLRITFHSRPLHK